ncbi:MAG: hypothetical protein HQ568_07115 [Calditrichaeota bacterium]|nr:hypothetical protein [Calditrichota bacterium]
MRLISTILFLMFVVGCASRQSFVKPHPLPDDREHTRCPEYRDTFNDFTDFFEQQFTLQADQFVDVSRVIRNISNNPKEAYNVDAFDEVANSSWFTNRNEIKRMSLEEITTGPNSGNYPDTKNTWTIIRAKMEGVTAGFTIVDARGDKYVIKFDPLGFGGLNSGSEVIGAKLFYAAGYFVPENYVCFFDPSILKLGDNVKLKDDKGRKRLMTEDDLTQVLSELQYEPNGLIRATVSKYIPGRILGPFKYDGTRSDDLNDLIPHQHRRELRALRVVGAWLNHIDAKGANSMDAYIRDGKKGYVRHYLIDLGTILGSGGRGPQPIYRGHENEMDPHAVLFRIMTLGLYVPKWERVSDSVEYPCIGRINSEYFHPRKFKPVFPNPAYDNLTDNDGYWGAKLVMSFTDEQLAAVVAEAKYPDSEAAEYLLKTLIERRYITGRYWFNRVAPLDDFELITNENDMQVLRFSDLSIETGLEPQDKTTYRYMLKRNGQLIKPFAELLNATSIQLPDLRKSVYRFVKSDTDENQWEITIQLKRDSDKRWRKGIKVFLSEVDQSQQFELIGLRHL